MNNDSDDLRMDTSLRNYLVLEVIVRDEVVLCQDEDRAGWVHSRCGLRHMRVLFRGGD
jgi:hypothetical protein